MKKVITQIKIFFLALLLICCGIKNNYAQPVNAIIGDRSYISKFGVSPVATTNEDLRIKTHLEYVENILRQKDVIALSEMQKEKRKQLLDLLHNYWTAEVFPKNYDYRDQRIPCFIDKDGRVCAVGYLIEQTAGRSIAEQINGRHKYEEILSMNDEVVDSWIETSGLTKEECAMIQPEYGYQPQMLYSWTSATIVVGPTKKEIALGEKVDSLQVLSDSLILANDSLNLSLKNQVIKADSLSEVLENKGAEISMLTDDLEKHRKNSGWIIMSLAGVLGGLILFMTIKFMRRTKSS